MLTPAKRHFQKATAAIEAANMADPDAPVDANQYELMLIQLGEHKLTLKKVQSTELKAARKKDFLPEYEAYIDGVLESNAGAQDDVLMTIMLWRIDAGDIAGAIAIGEYAIEHKLTMPDQYKRDTATTLVEEAADLVLKTPGTVSVENLITLGHMTAESDMPDQVRAKLHKALGFEQTKLDPAIALSNLQRAFELDSKAGVKKQIEKLQRELKKN